MARQRSFNEKNGKVRGVIFDLDGTLLDTLRDIADSMNCVLRELGCPTHPLAAYRFFTGDGFAKLVGRSTQSKVGSEFDEEFLLARFASEYALRWPLHSRPYLGIKKMLATLERKAVPFAVLSNKEDEVARIMVASLLPSCRFAAVYGARPGIPTKPDPAAARAIASELDLPCAELLYVGDTPVDMQTAIAAGMIPLGVKWGFRPAAELLAHGARALLNSPHELLSLLE